MCRSLGVRVISGFMIGFPEDTKASIRAVLRYAKQVNPYAANFNICTPYPGTGFINEIEPFIASRDWSRYDVYSANLKYEHLTAELVEELHRECFRHYYFRWEYLRANWAFLMPRLHAAVTTTRGWLGLSGKSGASQPAVADVPAARAATLPIIESTAVESCGHGASAHAAEQHRRAA
ncbi:MAG: hypothetical protein EHM42_06370 [Planctomycetaceae bacterium]|nr:MAG: hypothetical protein EHM42_06370 [Planctomycetaceae bacterium]